MGIIRDSFIIFKNWAEAINKLPDEYQLETYKALVEYGFSGEMPEKISPITSAMLTSFSVGMENSICRYKASVENGKKGGRPSKNDNQTQPSDNQNESEKNLEKPNKTQTNQDKPTHNLNVNVNDNVNININKKERVERKKTAVFTPPTLEEIIAYANERNSIVNPQKFFDFYEAGKWIDSNGKSVKNWKQKFITWENKEKDRLASKQIKQAQQESQLERAAKRLGVNL